MSGIAGFVMFVLFLAGAAAGLAGAVIIMPPVTRTVFLAPAIGLWLLALVAWGVVGVIAAILSLRPSSAPPTVADGPSPTAGAQP